MTWSLYLYNCDGCIGDDGDDGGYNGDDHIDGVCTGDGAWQMFGRRPVSARLGKWSKELRQVWSYWRIAQQKTKHMAYGGILVIY